MTSKEIPELILALVLITTFFIAVFWMMKKGAITIAKSEEFEDDIKNDLKKRGMKLVDIQMPGAFDTGPFPKFEIISFGFQSHIFNFRGEKIRYRKVKYKDRRGRVKESWVKLKFIAFSLVSIKWSPEL